MSTSSASGSTATVAAEVWMRPLASVAGTRCTRCTPDSNLSRANTPLPVTVGDDFLVAAGIALALREHLHLPAMEVGVALVHAEEIAGEERRLVAAGAGADFEDGALLVGRVLGEEQAADGLGQGRDALVERLRLVRAPASPISGSSRSAVEPLALGFRRAAARAIAS